MSKGSNPRPFEIPQEEYASNHERIFGAPKARERYIPPPLPSAPVKLRLPNGKQPHEAEFHMYGGPQGVISVRVKPEKDVDHKNNS